jgi:hypothetical protein
MQKSKIFIIAITIGLLSCTIHDAGPDECIRPTPSPTVSPSPAWAQEAYLKAVNNHSGDFFGSLVAIDGDTIAVSSYYETSNHTGIINGTTASENTSCGGSGAVYVYKRSGSTWQQEAYIKSSNNDESDRFGYCLALEGDTLAVGACQEDSNQATITNGTSVSFNDSNNNSGAVYVFKRSGTTWQQEAYLKAANNSAYDYFGSS